MSAETDISPKKLRHLADIKSHIKRWESEYFKENGHKPSKEDIDSAPQDIKDSYRQYWKVRKSVDSSNSSSPSLANDAWSCELNKANMAKKKISSELRVIESYTEKLKREASITNEVVKDFRYVKGFQRNIFIKRKSLTDEKIKSTCDQGTTSASAAEDGSQEHESKALISDVLTPNGLSHKKHINIIKSHSNSPNPKSSINILSSPLGCISSTKAHFQLNVNPGWLERCTTVNDDKKSPVKHSDVSEIISVNKTDNELRNSTSKSQKGSSDNSCATILSNVRESYSSPKDNAGFGHSIVPPETESHNCESSTYSATESFDNSHMKSSKKCPEEDRMSEASVTEGICVEPENEECRTVIISNKHLEDDTSKYNDVVLVKKKKTAKKRKMCDNPAIDDAILEKHNMHKSDRMEHLAKKSSRSMSNDNYVRINLKKKIFVRGHRHINVRKMKFQKWKQLKKNNGNSTIVASSSACFKCGKPGHWARNCTEAKETELLPQYDDDILKSPLPTLEEAAEMAKNSAAGATTCTKLYKDQPRFEDPKVETEILNERVKAEEPIMIDDQNDLVKKTVLPLYEKPNDGKPLDAPKEVLKALKKMGYSEFRPGQEKAVMRILSGMSTLVVSATGSGKSLCYQLPAYLYAQKYNCISLVISPLVSLMEDQIIGLPSCLHAVCLHSGMSETQKETAFSAILNGAVQILLVSPEAIIGGKLGGNFRFSKLPPIAFACIDEAHCLSEWSHNFRPSYLQIFKVLTDKMNVKCVLGLTATATRSILKNIANHLKLEETDESVIGETNVPLNLLLTVSRDKDKDWALIELLKGERFCSCNSILIYCIRREETERIATLIRTCLQQESSVGLSEEATGKKSDKTKTKRGKQLHWSAEAYHAGLRPHKRHSVQKNFMAGKLHVVVATIAFGMGLDKADVRAIIHYNMPKSFENYVQEIGRAGRDGLPAQCHLFLDSEGRDLWELRRHIYSNSIDRRMIRKLLGKVFVPCKCSEAKEAQSKNDHSSPETLDAHTVCGLPGKCLKHERAFPIKETVQELDLKEENITTLLCYLESHSSNWIEILSPTYATCTIRCYGGPKQMKSLGHKCPVIAAAMALDKKKWDVSNQYQFQITDVASYMSWDSGIVKRNLKQLEWTQSNGKNRKTGVMVEFSDLAFHIKARGDLGNDELDAVLEFLCGRVKTQEEKELFRLNYVFSTFLTHSFTNYWSCDDMVSQQRSDVIKSKIKKYFDEDSSAEQSCELNVLDNQEKVSIPEIRQHIKDLVNTHRDHSFTGRAIARILHGISSPCYPAEIWGRVHRFWRSYLNVDFNFLLKLANEEILKLR